MSTTGSNEKIFSSQTRDKIRLVLESVHTCGIKLPIVFDITIDALPILGWLESSPASCKLYWCGRDSKFEFGGTGVGFEIDQSSDGSDLNSAEAIIEASPFGGDLLFFCGQSFSGTDPTDPTDPNWEEFRSQVSMIPEMMVIRREDSFKLRFCLTLLPSDDIDCIMDRANTLVSNRSDFVIDLARLKAKRTVSEVVSIKHHPDFEGWSENIATSLMRISAGEIKKIVLARRTDICLTKKPNPVTILDQLTGENKNCYAVLFQPNPDKAFICLSPERLFRLTGPQLLTEAISSTVARGKDADDDRRLEKELVDSKKQKREHRYVVEGLGRAMRPICQADPSIGATDVLKLNRIQHLLTPVGGELKKEISGSDVVRALHPTAAVGGTPRLKAVPMIGALEPFERGWYAAPIGYVSKNRSEFAVGIRSALVHGCTISVFSGAGIVRGSSAEAEWSEIESKNILRSLLPDKAKV